jgi:recombinational DNA repair protein (RecF pathway)
MYIDGFYQECVFCGEQKAPMATTGTSAVICKECAEKAVAAFAESEAKHKQMMTLRCAPSVPRWYPDDFK